MIARATYIMYQAKLPLNQRSYTKGLYPNPTLSPQQNLTLPNTDKNSKLFKEVKTTVVNTKHLLEKHTTNGKWTEKHYIEIQQN